VLTDAILASAYRSHLVNDASSAAAPGDFFVSALDLTDKSFPVWLEDEVAVCEPPSIADSNNLKDTRQERKLVDGLESPCRRPERDDGGDADGGHGVLVLNFVPLPRPGQP